MGLNARQFVLALIGAMIITCSLLQAMRQYGVVLSYHSLFSPPTRQLGNTTSWVLPPLVNTSALCALTEQLYAELGPAMEQLIRVERQLLRETKPAESGSGAQRRTLDASSSGYLEQVEQLTSWKTVVYHVKTPTFLSVLSSRVYAVHSNDCGRVGGEKNKFVDPYGLKCWEVEVPAMPFHSFLSEQQYWDFTVVGNYNYQLGQFSKQEVKGSSAGRADHVGIGYVHVVRDAVLMRNGDVRTGATYVSILRCARKSREKMTERTMPIYDKVFSIAQYWGQGYYHFTIEDLPRVALSLPFLLQNEDVHVHVVTGNSFVKSLLAEVGISGLRLVSGMVGARIAYVPGGTACGRASIVPISLLSTVFRSRPVWGQGKRDTLVLIRRSARRWFEEHDNILRMLESIAARTPHLKVEVFADNPSPPLSTTKRLFNRAVLVVGPHGAGLSNIIFSEPGTCVVEGLCYDGSKSINPCYRHLTQVLGHVYYGIVPRRQCLQTGVTDLWPAVVQCLQWMHQPNDLAP